MAVEVEERALEFVIILLVLATISWTIELGLHKLIKYFKHHQLFHLVELINKLSQELMVLGLVSLVVFIVTNQINFGTEDTERFEIEHLEVFVLGIACVLLVAYLLKGRIRNPKSKNFQWNKERFIVLFGLDPSFDYLYHLEQSYKVGVVRLGNFNMVMWIIFAIVALLDGTSINGNDTILGYIASTLSIALSAVAFTILRRVFQYKLGKFTRESYQVQEPVPVLKASESLPLINSGEPLHGSLANLEDKSLQEIKKFVIWLTRLGRLVLFWFSLDSFVSILFLCLTAFDWLAFLFGLVKIAFYTYIYMKFYQQMYFAWAYLINPHHRNCYKYAAESH